MARCKTCEDAGEDLHFDRCWGCGHKDELEWIDGFGYGKSCKCSGDKELHEKSKKFTTRQIYRRVDRLYR